MTQTTGDRVTTGRSLDDPAGPKQEWRTPRLTMLGDADKVTAVNTLANPTDGTTVLAEFS